MSTNLIILFTAAKRITNKIPKTLQELQSTIKNLSQNNQNNSFYLRHTNADEVIKAIKSLKND